MHILVKIVKFNRHSTRNLEHCLCGFITLIQTEKVIMGFTPHNSILTFWPIPTLLWKQGNMMLASLLNSMEVHFCHIKQTKTKISTS